jgi:hypothetical protein
VGFNEVVKQLEGLVVITSVVGIIFALLKTGTTKATIQSQKELIETLTAQVNELRNLHIENEKAISELQGQVSVYKELPLNQLSTSMAEIAKAQKDILRLLKQK